MNSGLTEAQGTKGNQGRGKARFVVILLAVAVLAGIGVIWSSARKKERFACRIVDTNIVSVSFRVTHGLDHVFYYPGPVRWGFEEVCKKLGMLKQGKSQRLVTHTYQEADVLWVISKHNGTLLGQKWFRAISATPEGGNRGIRSTGEMCDGERNVIISRWPLLNGSSSLTNSALSVVDVDPGERALPNPNGKELMVISVR